VRGVTAGLRPAVGLAGDANPIVCRQAGAPLQFVGACSPPSAHAEIAPRERSSGRVLFWDSDHGLIEHVSPSGVTEQLVLHEANLDGTFCQAGDILDFYVGPPPVQDGRKRRALDAVGGKSNALFKMKATFPSDMLPTERALMTAVILRHGGVIHASPLDPRANCGVGAPSDFPAERRFISNSDTGKFCFISNCEVTRVILAHCAQFKRLRTGTRESQCTASILNARRAVPAPVQYNGEPAFIDTGHGYSLATNFFKTLRGLVIDAVPGTNDDSARMRRPERPLLLDFKLKPTKHPTDPEEDKFTLRRIQDFLRQRNKFRRGCRARSRSSAADLGKRIHTHKQGAASTSTSCIPRKKRRLELPAAGSARGQ